MTVYLKKPNRSRYGRPIARVVIWQTCNNPAHRPTHDPRDYNEACGRIQGHIMARSRWERLYGAWKAAGKLPDPCPCRECNRERRAVERWERMAREMLAYHGNKSTMNEQEARSLYREITAEYPRWYTLEVCSIDGAWFLYHENRPDYLYLFDRADWERYRGACEDELRRYYGRAA